MTRERRPRRGARHEQTERAPRGWPRFRRLVDAWRDDRRERTPMRHGTRVASIEAVLGGDMTPGRNARWERLGLEDDAPAEPSPPWDGVTHGEQDEPRHEQQQEEVQQLPEEPTTEGMRPDPQGTSDRDAPGHDDRDPDPVSMPMAGSPDSDATDPGVALEDAWFRASLDDVVPTDTPDRDAVIARAVDIARDRFLARGAVTWPEHALDLALQLQTERDDELGRAGPQNHEEPVTAPGDRREAEQAEVEDGELEP